MAGILFTDEDFEDLIMAAFLEKYGNANDIPHLSASKGFQKEPWNRFKKMSDKKKT